MSRTRQDLIAEVLDILGVTEIGQQPDAEDAENVDKKIDGVFARLSRRNIIYIQDADLIDDEYMRPLAVIIAGSMDRGTAPDANSVQYNEALLREMQLEPGTNAPVVAVYY